VTCESRAPDCDEERCFSTRNRCQSVSVISLQPITATPNAPDAVPFVDPQPEPPRRSILDGQIPTTDREKRGQNSSSSARSAHDKL